MGRDVEPASKLIPATAEEKTRLRNFIARDATAGERDDFLHTNAAFLSERAKSAFLDMNAKDQYRVIAEGQMTPCENSTEVLYARIRSFMEMEKKVRSLASSDDPSRLQKREAVVPSVALEIAAQIAHPMFEEVPDSERRCAGFERPPEDCQCPKGHKMSLVRDCDGTCDRCKREVTKAPRVLECGACNWWLCENCFTKDEASSPGVVEGTCRGVDGVVEALQKKYGMQKGERARVVAETKELWKITGDRTLPKVQCNTGWKWIIKGAEEEARRKAEEAARRKKEKQENQLRENAREERGEKQKTAKETEKKKKKNEKEKKDKRNNHKAGRRTRSASSEAVASSSSRPSSVSSSVSSSHSRDASRKRKWQVQKNDKKGKGEETDRDEEDKKGRARRSDDKKEKRRRKACTQGSSSFSDSSSDFARARRSRECSSSGSRSRSLSRSRHQGRKCSHVGGKRRR
eukprot:TRINITY_DN33657_c0_g1_i1.p1 TRINITY_DN33657_c0_g1~~TRINITY_DN33657_c0_g1_i1.p1  ORF type:complete len:473 (-),score=96.01 TRINITY_DN33657_c0_g1_i1:127-1509(-)